MDMLPKTKYNHLRNASSSPSLSPSPTLSPSPSGLPASISSSSLTPMLPPQSPNLDDSPTTLCSFFPRMGALRLSGPGGLLPGLRVSRTTGPSGDATSDMETATVSLTNSPPPPLPPQDMNRLGAGVRRTRVEGGQLGGDEWTRHGSFVNKPTRGWLHPDSIVTGPGVSYPVRYMGCVEVLQSMRALDFNTRTQVTREAIAVVCEAVPGAKGAMRRRKPTSRSLTSILGKSNLQFAGMAINLTISTSSLNLMATECKQIIANHHMQSISFASGGDPDTAEYVAYVAKDPVNQRACHILECSEGRAQDVISTIGQAFELRFKQYLKNPPKLVTPHDRMAPFDGSAWDEEDEDPASDIQYYNDYPGKEPPLGGLVDLRVRDAGSGARSGVSSATTTGATLVILLISRERDLAPPLPGVKPYSRTDLFDDPSYVNVDKSRAHNSTANGNPFEDALRVNAPASGCPPSCPVAPPMEEQLRREIWFHGKMSRKDAEKLLKANGDFLVRESTTTPGQYVLTGLQVGQPKHLLLVDPEGVVRTKDHRFESVSHLVSYHMDNHLPIISAGSEVCLQQPVERRS
uniref:SHC-transforming protein 1 n=2 Tax=Erpetoichthys calabaricus TaxID=27687 RepID=A0A8C4RLH1_ERPCA